MNKAHDSSTMIYAAGTQVVTNKPVQNVAGKIAHPVGAVGVIVRSPQDRQHAYRVRFTDGFEAPLHHDNLTLLAVYKQGGLVEPPCDLSHNGLFDRVIYRCVIGSRAYGLDQEQSDTDRRGIYLPPAARHWSLFGVPAQLENEERQEAYWELQKFLVLALKANPNVLECFYSPLVETVTPLAQELLDMKQVFLSRLVYQTYNGYVMSQFKKLQADLRNQGRVKWKHVMHLIRLLLSGITVLREGFVPVRVSEHRDALLSIKAGELPWAQIDNWRLELHQQFERAFIDTKLPERPDYERANDFLVKARALAINEQLP
jgi:hypothetical protein